MIISSCYPVIMTDNPAETALFYRRHFGFEPTFESDWYISLRNAVAERVWELAILLFNHETVPEDSRYPARGILLNFEVEDAKSEYARLVGSGDLTAVLPLRDEEFGQRHFILKDPAGNLVDVIQPIPPSEEFLTQYTGR